MKRLAKLTAILIVLAIVLLAGLLAGDHLLESWNICPTALGVGEHVLVQAVGQNDDRCTPEVDCGLNVGFWLTEANQGPLGLKRCAPCVTFAGLAVTVQEGQDVPLNDC